MVWESAYWLDRELVYELDELRICESPAFFFYSAVEVERTLENNWFSCLDFLYFVLDVY